MSIFVFPCFSPLVLFVLHSSRNTVCAHTPIIRIYITCCSHLGEEVALYCSKYLPDIIKEQKTYKDGKLQKVRSRRSHSMTFFFKNKFDRAETLMTGGVLLKCGTVTNEVGGWMLHLTCTDSPFCVLFPGSGGCLLGHRQQNDHRGSHQGAGPDRWTAHRGAAH